MFAATNLQHTAQQPVLFDSVATGQNGSTSSNSISTSWTHTSSGQDRAVIVALSVLTTGGDYSLHDRNVTYGGASMFSVGAIHANNTSGYGWIEYFFLFNPPLGPQTVSATIAKTSTSYYRLSGSSLSYKNCRGFTGVSTGFGTEVGTALSQTVSSLPAERVVQTFMTYSALQSGSITGYDQSQRFIFPALGASNDDSVIGGDAAGAASVTFTATRTVADQDYAALVVRLLPGFNSFSIVNASLTNVPIPQGASQYRVRLRGAGGGGGRGRVASFANCAPGGGGGGGGYADTDWRSVSELGTSYSVSFQPVTTAMQTDGGASIFTSGSVTITANGGLAGETATGFAATVGGAGGTVSASGTTLSVSENGAAGADSGGQHGVAGNNSVLAGPGGGSGSYHYNNFNSDYGGDGGSSANAAGGTGRYQNSGNPGDDAPLGYAGGGGAGGGKSSANARSGASGGSTGAGGGGGAGGTGGGTSLGGSGGAGEAIVEFA